ncbi:MAG: SUMF1/EgtB/PvdO family nonheme iron enzyme [Pirellulales bacterium]
MLSAKRNQTLVALGLSTLMLCLAAAFAEPLLLLAALAGYVFVGMRYGTRWRIERGRLLSQWRRQAEKPADEAADAVAVPVGREESDDLVGEILRRRRHALLARPQLAATLGPAHVAAALAALHESMAVVPQGRVLLDGNAPSLTDTPAEDRQMNDVVEVWVDAVLIDRYPVSNEDYQHFVDDGGYEQMELWATEILPALLDFVDRTGLPGPRYWRDGRHPAGLARHPVVGICWYEAAAYARWVGKRLPSDAEWVKAGCWPVQFGGEGIVQRDYPWGEAMDRSRAHLWSGESHGPVQIDQYAEGASVGGVHQLIGNVWEWTSSNFGTADMHLIAEGANRAGHAARLKSLRGGAFDTYFDSQATCHFQSGDQSIARKHNIGFRCALSLCDVVGCESMTTNREHHPMECETTAAAGDEELAAVGSREGG